MSVDINAVQFANNTRAAILRGEDPPPEVVKQAIDLLIGERKAQILANATPKTKRTSTKVDLSDLLGDSSSSDGT